MIELKGKYTDAKIFTDNVEQEAVDQIQRVIDNPMSEGSKVRIMSDVHAGKGCTIGTTMTITDKVCANLVGVDLGCGVLCLKFLDMKKEDLDLVEIDKKIRQVVPLGFAVNDKEPEWCKQELDELFGLLKCRDSLNNVERLRKSLGSLGGGNHYIEINEDDEGCIYLVVHTGSRNLGQQVALHYQKLAEEQMKEEHEQMKRRVLEEALKQDEMYIEEYLAKHKVEKLTKEDLSLACLTGDLLVDYLQDVNMVQNYAHLNRVTILMNIIEALDWHGGVQVISSVHNYVDVEHKILRKGAISAQKGEHVIIPLNMRDGSIIAVGKGNPDWNYSAPHGAGRVLGRKKAQATLKLEDFERTMNEAGVYSTSVSEKTLDESPFAYKKPQDILDYVRDTLDIVGIIKPIYNLKG